MKKRIVLLGLLQFLLISTQIVNGSHLSISFTEIGSIETNGEAMSVIVDEDIAFVLDTTDGNPGGLTIINVSDPTDPSEISSIYDGGNAYAIALKDDYAFIADGNDGIEIIDISDLENPIEVYQYPVSTYSSDVEIVNDLLFAANWDLGLEIFNISVPSSPVKIHQYNSNYLNCIQVAIEGDIACVTNHDNEFTSMRILNISIPTSPVLLDSLTVTGVDFWDPQIHENYLYVGNHGLGGGELQIFNVTDPSNLEQVSIFDNTGSIHHITINNSLAYLADYSKGIIVLDISDPTNPTKIGQYHDIGGNSKWTYVQDDLLFVADRADGLEILQVDIITDLSPGIGFFSSAISILIVAIILWKKRLLRDGD